MLPILLRGGDPRRPLHVADGGPIGGTVSPAREWALQRRKERRSARPPAPTLVRMSVQGAGTAPGPGPPPVAAPRVPAG